MGHAPGNSDCIRCSSTLALQTDTTESPWPTQCFVRGKCATLRQTRWVEKLNLLLRIPQQQIKLPQSGTCWDTTLASQVNPKHDRCTTILTDWNRSLKHARWLHALFAVQPGPCLTDWIITSVNIEYEMVSSAPFQASSSSSPHGYGFH